MKRVAFIGGYDKTEVGMTDRHKTRPGEFEPMCNPVAQAELLNGQNETTQEIKLILDREGDFTMQMFSAINMSNTAIDQRAIYVSTDRISTQLSLNTVGMDKATAKKLFMADIDLNFEKAWAQQEEWRTKSPSSK